MKSLVCCVSADDLVNEQMLRLIKPANIEKVVVWIEGKDWRVYRKFFNASKIIEAGNAGCRLISDAYRMLKEKKSSLNSILIRDADFRRLEGTNLNVDPNVFYTDGHDVEMMMLKQQTVRQKVCEVFEYTGNVEAFYNEIFQELAPLSYFKWFSHHYGNCYSFERLSKLRQSKENIMDLRWIENTTYDCSKSKWDHSIHSTPFEKINVTDVQSFMDANSSADKFELTNGHDYCNRLVLHLQDKTNYVRNEESINDSIIISFDYDQFKKTDLHKSLRAWCDANVDILK